MENNNLIIYEHLCQLIFNCFELIRQFIIIKLTRLKMKNIYALLF